MYASVNFPSKKALRTAVAAGDAITTWSPGPFPPLENGVVALEGPWYPKPHSWYARVRVVDGVIVEVAE